MAGLTCSVNRGECVPGSVLLNPDLFTGEYCFEDEEADMPFGVRAHIPRTQDKASSEYRDFYSLPFPNDYRINDEGFVDLSGHPRPGGGITGIDLAGAVIDGIESELTGFSVEAAVYFRLTRDLCQGDPDESDANAVAAAQQCEERVDDLALGMGELYDAIRFVNLDEPGGPDHPFEAVFRPARNKYICGNHLYVHPRWSSPLEVNTTYAVIITKGMTYYDSNTSKEEVPQRLDDLNILLGSSAPGDAELKKAWDAYAPLRDWLPGSGIPESDVVGATVFTTGDPTALIRAMPEVARSHDVAPFPEGWVVCGKGKDDQDPCASEGSEEADIEGAVASRACPANAADLPYWEIHAQLAVPIFQEGYSDNLEETLVPYNFAGGGAIAVEDGKPKVVGTEKVCIALSVPKAPKDAPPGYDGVVPPTDGWPLLIFGHGTLGNYRNGVQHFAGMLSTYGIPLVVLGVDQPMHGPRRGKSAENPGPLFYNFSNPPAAKGNLYQGAADNFSLIRFARALQAVPGIGQVKIDQENMFYKGHSQGGTTGPIFAPYEDGLKGVIFSGTGGSLVHGLLEKKEPYDARVGITLALQELEMDEYHPVLHLMQFYFDETDPLIHARHVFKDPAGKPLHMLHVYGHDDNYTPPITSRFFAAASGAAIAEATGNFSGEFDTFEGHDVQIGTLPISANYDSESGPITGVTVQHSPDGTYDGHFVAFRNEACIKQIGGFILSMISDGVPEVPTGD